MILEVSGSSPLVTSDMDDLLRFSLLGESWLYKLNDKKVLIVHPMKNTIVHQMTYLDKIWPGLSFGEIIVVNPPYSPYVTGIKEYDSYFVALDYLKQEISKINFDVAIVGAGAYSLPLLAFIKNEKKVPSVHLGGNTQLIFGIKGNRWDVDYEKSHEGRCWLRNNFYNSNNYWIKPLAADTPPQSELCENSCYW